MNIFVDYGRVFDYFLYVVLTHFFGGGAMATQKESGKTTKELVVKAEAEVNRLANAEAELQVQLSNARAWLKNQLRRNATGPELDAAVADELDTEQKLRQAKADLRRARALAHKLRSQA